MATINALQQYRSLFLHQINSSYSLNNRTCYEEPLIEADEHWFMMTLKRKHIEKSKGKLASKKSDSKETTEKILLLLHQQPQISIFEMANALGMIVHRIDCQIR